MKQFPAIAQTFILTGFSLSALSLFAVSPAQAAYFRGLGFLDSSNPYRSSSASGISADGSVVIGSSNNTNGLEAFRWTQSDGMVSLANLDGGNFSSGANDVSDDGSVVVGVIYNRLDGSEAFRWTQSGGMVGLGFLSGDSFNSQANEVSADGSVVVGSSDSVNGHEAFRWTQSGGMVGLGFLSSDNFLYSSADGVSADGSVIVGKSKG
jgi:probable HAF family extracellular repeat protein